MRCVLQQMRQSLPQRLRAVTGQSPSRGDRVHAERGFAMRPRPAGRMVKAGWGECGCGVLNVAVRCGMGVCDALHAATGEGDSGCSRVCLTSRVWLSAGSLVEGTMFVPDAQLL
jgi:hypothetical protein